MNILVFDKKRTSKIKLSPRMTLREYQCKCHRRACTRTLVLASTVKSFAAVRREYGKPIRINSAFRCQAHNAKVGGRINSFHLIGAALDLVPAADVFHAEELDKLEMIALLYFDTVLRYEGFIHCHNTGDNNNGQENAN